jgi:signal transduction histidine kinase
MPVFNSISIAPESSHNLRPNGHSPDLASLAMPRGTANSWIDEIAMISHELRNSLGVVRNAARLMRLPAGDNAIDSARVLIERHVGHMSRHVEELVGASREAQQRVLRLSHVDLRSVVDYAINATASDMATHGHRLVVRLPADAIWMNADVARLEQVFLNLLINAAKYTPDAGDITLTMERIGGNARIRICDSGIGISAEMLGRIFQLFAQVTAQDARAEGGRGIGLAVVRDLVEAHGGSVQATSAGLGSGSQFTVLLPTLWAQAAIEPPDSSSR